MKKITYTSIKKFLQLPLWLVLLLAFIFVLRIPSFAEPYYYGDEMIYLTLGEAIKQGEVLYKDIHDNKPPLLYVTAAIAGNVFWFRVILAFWNLTTIIIFYKLVEVLFPKKSILQKLATTIFATLTTIPLLEGNIPNSEVFMIGPTILAFYILFTKNHTPKTLVISGVLFSIATLFKVPAAFDLPVIVFYWILTAKKLNKPMIVEIINKSIYLLIGFLTPIILTFVWYSLNGALGEYLQAAFLQNFGYLSTFRPDDIAEPFLVKNGPLLVRAFISALLIFVLWILRRKLSKQFIFLSIWLILALFATTLSERPYPHYLIQAVPSVSIFFAMLLSLNSIEQSLSIIPLTLAFFVPFYYQFWHYPTLSYYQHFVKFATGSLTKDQYFNGFGSNVTSNYKVASYLNNIKSTDEKIFVWGDNASIYALTRSLPPVKYTVDYHIHDFSNKKEIAEILSKDLPTYIVVTNSAEDYPELDIMLMDYYILLNEIDGTTIWKYFGLF